MISIPLCFKLLFSKQLYFFLWNSGNNKRDRNIFKNIIIFLKKIILKNKAKVIIAKKTASFLTHFVYENAVICDCSACG